MPEEAAPLRVAVLASGGGTNLQAMLDRFHTRHARQSVEIVLVIASRPGIGALERARIAEIPSAVVDAGLPAEQAEEQLLGRLEECGAELVVLAGYLRLVPPGVVRRFGGRILNVHPALLPAFGGAGMYGLRVHEAVLASEARVSGATVHLVDDEYDRGRILAQWPVPVLPGDTPERLAARVLAVEHRLLPAVVACLAGSPRRSLAAGEMAFDLVESATPGEPGMRGWVQLCDARQA